MAQCFNGIEFCCGYGWVHPEENADQHAETEAYAHGPALHDGRPAHRAVDDLGAGPPEEDADQAPGRAEDDGLNQKLLNDV